MATAKTTYVMVVEARTIRNTWCDGKLEYHERNTARLHAVAMMEKAQPYDEYSPAYKLIGYDERRVLKSKATIRSILPDANKNTVFLALYKTDKKYWIDLYKWNNGRWWSGQIEGMTALYLTDQQLGRVKAKMLAAYCALARGESAESVQHEFLDNP